MIISIAMLVYQRVPILLERLRLTALRHRLMVRAKPKSQRRSALSAGLT